MTMFSAEKEDRLLQARDAFRVAMLEDELCLSIVTTSIEDWKVSDDPATKVMMQPSLMPEQREQLYITGGVQIGFEMAAGPGIRREWRYIDLFTYLPGAVEYEVLPVVRERSNDDETEIATLYDCWRTAVHKLIEPFEPHDLRVNRYTGEIDLRENIEEGKMPILLPGSR